MKKGLGTGDWGLGTGYWGLGTGYLNQLSVIKFFADNCSLSPIPNA
ncbi:hypothetical protein JYQ62_12855 [Nostoc sp. UHCC 0702]|nr:hypothetical protein JYQ62_12855 [Nostoc sp. UHCC 0702]